MKLLITLFALVAPIAVHAQSMKDMDMKVEKKDARSPVHKASGVVTKVDPGKGKVSIKHGPVQSLGWPAMTMVFTVKDKATLDKLAQDKKVDFEFKEEGKDYVITSVE